MAERTEFPCPQDTDIIYLAVRSFMEQYHCNKVKVSVRGKVVEEVNGEKDYGELANWFMVLALEEQRGLLLETGQWVKPIGGFECLIQIEGKTSL